MGHLRHHGGERGLRHADPATDQPNVYAPYLAKSVTPSADYKTWTIGLRSGIKFQDGEPLNADAVKLNIDAWRKGVLLGFVFKNIANVTTQGDDTVIVTTTDPWVAFPAYLWSSGRTAIAAPAQINDDATCDTQHDRHRAVQADVVRPDHR